MRRRRDVGAYRIWRIRPEFYDYTRNGSGNGTAYSGSAAGYARMVIDRAWQAGDLVEAV